VKPCNGFGDMRAAERAEIVMTRERDAEEASRSRFFSDRARLRERRHGVVLACDHGERAAEERCGLA
jgi:hypothetical protein